MRGILGRILKIAIFTLAGIGALILADKYGQGKLPGYDTELSPGLNPLHIGWIVAAFVISHLVVDFIGNKTRIKLLQNSCR